MQKILTGANCISIPLRYFVPERNYTMLYQVRSDILYRLLCGEKFVLPWEELYEYFPPENITPLPPVLNNKYDFFLWSAMVDETTYPRDFYGIPFGPNLRYEDALRDINRIEEFYSLYPEIPRLTLKEREANYILVDELVTKENPNIKKILIGYNTKRLHEYNHIRAVEYDTAAQHMEDTLKPRGWKVYNVPDAIPARENDIYWAHYDYEWNKIWIKDIMRENGYVI